MRDRRISRYEGYELPEIMTTFDQAKGRLQGTAAPEEAPEFGLKTSITNYKVEILYIFHFWDHRILSGDYAVRTALLCLCPRIRIRKGSY
jgi:hypothetical protein